MAKDWQNIEEPEVSVQRNLFGHTLAGLLCKRQFEKVLLKKGGVKAPTWECVFVHRQQSLFLSLYVDDIRAAREEAQSGIHVKKD